MMFFVPIPDFKVSPSVLKYKELLIKELEFHRYTLDIARFEDVFHVMDSDGNINFIQDFGVYTGLGNCDSNVAYVNLYPAYKKDISDEAIDDILSKSELRVHIYKEGAFSLVVKDCFQEAGEHQPSQGERYIVYNINIFQFSKISMEKCERLLTNMSKPIPESRMRAEPEGVAKMIIEDLVKRYLAVHSQDESIIKPPPSTPATCDPKKPLKLLTKNCILEKGKLMVVFMDAYEKVTRRDMEEGTDSVVDDIRHERLDELVCDGYNQVYESRYREQVAMVSEEMKVFPCTYSPTIVHPRPLRQQLTRPTYAEYYKFEEYCTEMRGYRVRGLNAVEKYEEKLHGGRPWEVAEKKKRKRRKRVKSSAFDSVLKVPSPDLPSSDDQDAGAPPAAVDPA